MVSLIVGGQVHGLPRVDGAAVQSDGAESPGQAEESVRRKIKLESCSIQSQE